MIRSLYFTPTGKLQTNLTVDDYKMALLEPKGVLWVDFETTPAEQDAPILLDVFGFHPLAVDDALDETHVPKVDDWEQYLYIVLESISFQRGDGTLDLSELDVFLGKNFIVTHHDIPIVALNRVWDTTLKNDRHIKHGADHILYKLTDELAVEYVSVVEEMDEEIEWIEDQVFTKPTPLMVQRIFDLKRATMHLRRSVSPLREVLNRLARDDYAVVDVRDRVYFRDVYDHLVRIHDITEGLRDLVGGALDTYLSVINNRMNDVMKTLTLITTLFMPISFVAGFFGMNFFQPVADSLQPWTAIGAFIATLGVMLLTMAGMFVWMKRRGWLG